MRCRSLWATVVDEWFSTAMQTRSRSGSESATGKTRLISEPTRGRHGRMG